MAKTSIKSDILKDIHYGQGTLGRWKWVDEEEGDSGRWSIHMTTVLQDVGTNKFWAYNWQAGLTEYQENDYPWYGVEEVELFEVVSVEVTVKEWRTV